ncbi:MAG: ABC transporter substrate-binding protein [Clostridia bacterium]|nr:ABC transporter substrate-binding protein [Clostridia bacterium]
MNKKSHLTAAVALSALFAFLPLSACAEKDDDGLTTLKINEVTHSVFYAPLYLADALGYFEEEGLKIELTNGGGADNVMASVLSGDSDIGFCGPEAALYVLIGGSSDVPKVFGQLTKRDGSFLVSRTPEPNFKWEDLKGKEILAGRKGGVPAMTFEYVLKAHGLTDGVDVNLNYDVAFNLMTSAFEAGTADYCTMFDPVAYEYEAAGKGYVVASVGEESGEIPYTCFMAKQSWLNKNERKAEGFLRAVMKAIKYVNETSETTVAPYLKKYFESTSEASLAASVKRYKAIDSWQTGMAMDEASFTRLQDVIDGAGELSRRVSLNELAVNSYAEKIYGELYK